MLNCIRLRLLYQTERSDLYVYQHSNLNAQVILPDALVKELQTYVQGGYIYVPVEQKQQKRWGEVSGYRQELAQRNQQIKEEYQSGISMESLSEKYCLSLYAVRKIIYQKQP